MVHDLISATTTSKFLRRFLSFNPSHSVNIKKLNTSTYMEDTFSTNWLSEVSLSLTRSENTSKTKCTSRCFFFSCRLKLSNGLLLSNCTFFVTRLTCLKTHIFFFIFSTVFFSEHEHLISVLQFL